MMFERKTKSLSRAPLKSGVPARPNRGLETKQSLSEKTSFDLFPPTKKPRMRTKDELSEKDYYVVVLIRANVFSADVPRGAYTRVRKDKITYVRLRLMATARRKELLCFVLLEFVIG